MIEHNGKMYARVSEIIKPFVDFGGIDKKVLKRKAELGTRVHEAIQQEIEGGMPALDPKEQKYLQSWALWRNALMPEFINTEKRIYDDMRMVTGCIDAVVRFPGEERVVIVDWKTSVIEGAITWPMQAHLYFYLASGCIEWLSKRFLFVKLDREGKMPKVFQYHFNEVILGGCMQAIQDFWERQKGLQ